jgi:uncharacterized protein
VPVLFWRRTDLEGLERLTLEVQADRITAKSTVISIEGGGLRLDHRWVLTPGWRAQSVEIERWNEQGHEKLRVVRVGKTGWEVNGAARSDLDGTEEPDLSVTPFCNTFPIRRVPLAAGESLTLDTAFIDGEALTVTRSSQRYERQGAARLRFVDLGIFNGFTAELEVDGDGLVKKYAGLFERV